MGNDDNNWLTKIFSYDDLDDENISKPSTMQGNTVSDNNSSRKCFCSLPFFIGKNRFRFNVTINKTNNSEIIDDKNIKAPQHESDLVPGNPTELEDMSKCVVDAQDCIEPSTVNGPNKWCMCGTLQTDI